MYRAPEMLDLYQNFAINEALDIWVRICQQKSYFIVNLYPFLIKLKCPYKYFVKLFILFYFIGLSFD